MTSVYIVDTGIANTASVRACFERLGYDTELSADPFAIRNADFVVLPGVGQFGAGMQALERFRLIQPLLERVQSNAPLLGICLGMQLLCTTSEETEGVSGLGVIKQRVSRFPTYVRTPQHGWNRVGDEYAYFSNSYRIQSIPEGWEGVISNHGGEFVALLRKSSLLACQFHPELSGSYGKRLITDWIESRKGSLIC